jgi:TPR repeat protein
MGVFYDEGFGVNKNLEKAVGYLNKSAEAGNGHSMFQLYLIHSGN